MIFPFAIPPFSSSDSKYTVFEVKCNLRNKKSGKISPAAKNNNVLFHAEHLFLFIPHQGHCLLELLDAYVLF